MHTCLDGPIVVYGVTRIDLPAPSSKVNNGTPAAPRTFVAGPENRLILPVVEQLIQAEQWPTHPDWLNPLVIYGPSGTGKTHLVRGMVRRWGEQQGTEAVAYFTAADFARDLREARTAGNLAEFRERLSKLKLLVIEQLEQLPSRIAVHVELRNLIDTLAANDALVVVTAQRNPATLASLEPGVADRLAEGLMLPLRMPSSASRLEIMRIVADQRGYTIDELQLSQLAHQMEATAPALLGALAELQLQRDSGNREPFACESNLTLKQILAVVARYYSLSQTALRSSDRRKSLVLARGVTVYLARKLTSLSYSQIGKGLGRRDHTTIMHAYRNTERMLTTNPTTQQSIEELQRILTAR